MRLTRTPTTPTASGSLHLLGLVAIALLLIGSAAAAPATAATPLETDLKEISRSLGRTSSAYVYDITAGRRLLNTRASTRRIMASNAKLFTTAAALGSYGADGRLRTTAWIDGTVAGGVLTGDVYLRGGADPIFGSEAFVKRYYGYGASVEELAQKIALAGINEITGRIYGDETLFDSLRGTITSRYRRSGEIGGQLSGLMFDRGKANITGSAWQSDPPRFAAQRLRTALKALDLTVRGGTGVKATPVTASAIATAQSPAMSRLIALTNKPSDNFIAEAIVKGLSAGNTSMPVAPQPATTEAGAVTAVRFARTLGSRITLRDGSGLSRMDRSSPREVVDLLRGMQQRSDFDEFRASLSIPGIDGTLRRRMRGTVAADRCHGKTGTLSNVSALSGYCTTGGGRLIAYSILQNAVWPLGVHTVQDRIVLAIARSE